MGSLAVSTALENISIALSIAESRFSASTKICAPYDCVAAPVAMPLKGATASANSDTDDETVVASQDELDELFGK